MVKAISATRAQLARAGLTAATSTVQPGDKVRSRSGQLGTYQGLIGSIVCVDWSAS